MKQYKFRVSFVERIPPFNKFEDGTLYISILYNTAIHKCMCGCGSEIVTPISPTGWSLLYDGESASLSPSIGNLNYPCKSHYFLRGNRVVWLGTEKPNIIQRKSERRLSWWESIRNIFK
jgi:hypothetical protein